MNVAVQEKNNVENASNTNNSGDAQNPSGNDEKVINTGLSGFSIKITKKPVPSTPRGVLAE